jgi:hypothetical protein
LLDTTFERRFSSCLSPSEKNPTGFLAYSGRE